MLFRDTYALIDLNRLKRNVEKVHDKCQKPLLGVIKADAYGCGYKRVAMCLNDLDYMEMFAVATLKEAVDLRNLGITKDILILGAIPSRKEDIEIAVKYDISLALVSYDYLCLLESFIDSGTLKVHIKLDTGMNRVGLKTKEELAKVLRHIDSNKIDVEGIFTHFATADGDDTYYNQQLDKFYDMVGNMKFRYIHCCNSAALTYHEEPRSNLGRLGITMYGCDPAGNYDPDYEQVMSLYTKVAMVKKAYKGEHVGYGYTYEVEEDCYIATLPLGYADGFIRKNQGRKVYINGHYYEIIGRVCMDQFMIKADENVHVGDEAEIFGDHISLEQMAKELDTISYEIMCLISKRVERVYK